MLMEWLHRFLGMRKMYKVGFQSMLRVYMETEP